MNPLSLQNSRLLTYWLATSLSIAALSVFGRKIQVVIAEVIDQRWIAAAIFFILAVVLFRLQRFRHKDRKTTVISIAAVLLLAAGAAAVYGGVLQPVEAVHFLLFSWLGWISASAFGILYGTVAVLAVSFGDEILQYYLPDRVGDMHDIVINSVSGCIGLILRGK